MWRKLLKQLQRTMSQADIGKRIGVHASTVNRLLSGEIPEPSHSLGERIIALHAEVVGKKTA